MPLSNQDNTESSDTHSISQKFVEARHTHTGLAEYPGTIPNDLHTAYEIQSLAIGAWNDTIAGWKVGGVPPDYQQQFDEKRLAGPIFSKAVKHCRDEQHVDMPIFVDGYAAVEAEFVIELGDISELPTTDLSLDQVKLAISRVFIGIEIASSPLQIINDIGPVGPISDFGNNNGLIVGPEIVNWQKHDLSKYKVTVYINDEHIGTTSAKPDLDGPLGAVKFLIEHLRQHKYDIPKGTLVSTGAITGVHQAFVKAKSRVIFDGLGSMNITLVPSN